MTTGLGPVYDGIGHLLLSPDNLAVAIGIALVSGLRGPAMARKTTLLLPISWLVGGLIGAWHPTTVDSELMSGVFLLIVGCALAIDGGVPIYIAASSVALISLLTGWSNGSAFSEAGQGVGALQLAGTTITLFIIVCLVSAIAVSARNRPWRIVLRVAGSWTAATGLLLVGWVVRTHRH